MHTFARTASFAFLPKLCDAWEHYIRGSWPVVWVTNGVRVRVGSDCFVGESRSKTLEREAMKMKLEDGRA